MKVEWKCLSYAVSEISVTAVPPSSNHGYLPHHSHDGRLVAIAVNQPNTHDNCVMFVSPPTNTIVVSRLKGCGTKIPLTDKSVR